MMRTCLAATVTVMGLATAWAASQPADKPAAGEWTRLIHGIQCRLHISKSTFDVDELLPATGANNKTEVVLSLKNTAGKTVLVKTSSFRIRLLVHQDGKPVAPLFEQDWPDEDGSWDPRTIAVNNHWLDPGKEITFPVLFVGHDANFGTPLARYWLKPGRYQVKAHFRTQVQGLRHGDPSRPAQFETNTINITVTGTDKPLPRWTRRRADVSEPIPEPTKKLAQELRQLPPRQAAVRYVQEYDKALDAFGTIASALTRKSHLAGSGNHAYEKVTHVKGVGFVWTGGPDARSAKPVMWKDYVRKATAMDQGSSGGGWVDFGGSSLIYGYDSFSAITLPFPMRRYFAGVDSRWEAWREGDVLLISTGLYEYLVGIDLNNLAVLFRQPSYVYRPGGGYVYQYQKQHFLKGFPFPIPRLCVQESYSSRRATEPDRCWLNEHQTTLHKDRLKDFTVPPIPMPNTPGYSYYLPRENRLSNYRLEIFREKDGVLVGRLFEGRKSLAGKPGDVLPNSLDNLVYQQSPTRSGWFMDLKKPRTP